LIPSVPLSKIVVAAGSDAEAQAYIQSAGWAVADDGFVDIPPPVKGDLGRVEVAEMAQLGAYVTFLNQEKLTPKPDLTGGLVSGSGGAMVKG